jgi:hypothetical protein
MKDSTIITVFTVKHELISWYKDNKNEDYRVYRLRDSRNIPPVEITDELNETRLS